jgi:cytochrome oxidase Cu insertion factor (SCO1/SenC/PrrC family)
LIVSDEKDARHDLRAMAAGAPTLLLPIFTRCSGTCPLTALALKEALGKARAPFRVALLSFDTEDRAEDLSAFRERFVLPAEWLLLRSADAAATRAYFDELGFHFMKADGSFDHPNQTFVFSPRGAWVGTFSGAVFPKDELDAAWRRALAADDPTAFQRLGSWLIRPEAWILLALAGGTASLAAIVLVARKSRTTHRRATSP